MYYFVLAGGHFSHNLEPNYWITSSYVHTTHKTKLISFRCITLQNSLAPLMAGESAFFFSVFQIRICESTALKCIDWRPKTTEGQPVQEEPVCGRVGGSFHFFNFFPAYFSETTNFGVNFVKDGLLTTCSLWWNCDWQTFDLLSFVTLFNGKQNIPKHEAPKFKSCIASGWFGHHIQSLWKPFRLGVKWSDLAFSNCCLLSITERIT